MSFFTFRREPSSHVPSLRSSVLVAWWPVVLALTIIAIESSGTFSAEHTSGWLRPFLEGLLGHFHDDTWATFHHVLRKTGHFIGYGLVCVSFARAWMYTLAPNVRPMMLLWRIRIVLLAVFSTAVVATLDELHQATLASRTGKASDVLLDTCGGCFACLILWFAAKRKL